MRTLHLLLLFCCIDFTRAMAQSTVKIDGYVFSATGEALAGANVVEIETGIGTSTDATGYFAFENLFAGDYALQASFIGYRSEVREHISVGKESTVNVSFRLHPLVLSLRSVEVEAEAVPETSSDFYSLITSLDLQRSSAHTVGEILVNIAGVDIIDRGNEKKVSIRGSNTNQVLVLFDDIPLNDPITGDVDLDQVPLSVVEEIRVLKGGAGGTYGNGAMGGVIEIVSKKSPLDEAKINGQLGSYGMMALQPSASGSLGPVDFFVNYERVREDAGYNYTYERLDGTRVTESRLNGDFKSRSFFAKINLNWGAHSFGIQGNAFLSDRGLPGLVFNWTPFANAETHRGIFTGGYTFKNEKWQTSAQISHHTNTTEFRNLPPDDAPLRFRSVPAYHTRFRIRSVRASLESTRRLPGGHMVSAHGVFQQDDFDDRDLIAGFLGMVRETNNRNYAGNVRSEWQVPVPDFLSRCTLSQSLRFDRIAIKNSDITRTENHLSPEFGIFLSRATEWLLNIRANWGQSFRAPTFADLFFQDFRVRGNADLLPEKSTDFDAGLQMGFPWSGWLELSATYYHHDVENLIVWELGSFATWQPFNTDAEVRGWEFGGAWKLWRDRLQIDISHVLTDARDKSGRHTTQDKRLTYRPEYTSKVGLNLELGHLSLAYHKRFVGDRFVTPSNTVSMPKYEVDDVTLLLHARLLKAKSNIKLAVLNLFDHRYEIVEHAPLPGRNWRLGLEIGF